MAGSMRLEAEAPRRLTLIGYGNLARGDDAAGPLLLQRLQDGAGAAAGRYRLNFVEAVQLNPEHAYDLRDCAAVLFLDADSRGGALRLYALAADRHYPFSSHTQSPASVLALYETLEGRPPPAAFLLAIGGRQFGLGDPLSEHCRHNLRLAEDRLRRLWRAEVHQWPALWRRLTAAEGRAGAPRCA